MLDSIADKVIAIISGIVKEATGIDIQLTDDQSLIDSGIIDSLSIVTMMKQLQTEFNIEISAGDITLDNFDTLDAIIHFVSGRLE